MSFIPACTYLAGDPVGVSLDLLGWVGDTGHHRCLMTTVTFIAEVNETHGVFLAAAEIMHDVGDAQLPGLVIAAGCVTVAFLMKALRRLAHDLVTQRLGGAHEVLDLAYLDGARALAFSSCLNDLLKRQQSFLHVGERFDADLHGDELIVTSN